MIHSDLIQIQYEKHYKCSFNWSGFLIENSILTIQNLVFKGAMCKIFEKWSEVIHVQK